MNNAGQSSELSGKPSRFVPVVILGMVLVVILALVIGFQVVGVLVAIGFPPRPPLIADAVEVNHTTSNYGVDEWLYTVNLSACQVVEYYQSQGTCRVDACSNAERAPVNTRVATCEGFTPFSQFTMRWNARIDVASEDVQATVLTLEREILWSPYATPTP